MIFQDDESSPKSKVFQLFSSALKLSSAPSSRLNRLIKTAILLRKHNAARLFIHHKSFWLFCLSPPRFFSSLISRNISGNFHCLVFSEANAHDRGTHSLWNKSEDHSASGLAAAFFVVLGSFHVQRHHQRRSEMSQR